MRKKEEENTLRYLSGRVSVPSIPQRFELQPPLRHHHNIFGNND